MKTLNNLLFIKNLFAEKILNLQLIERLTDFNVNGNDNDNSEVGDSIQNN